MHAHFCPICKKTWDCSNAGNVWDQNDSDCRYYGDVVCRPCLRKGVIARHAEQQRTQPKTASTSHIAMR